MTKSKSKTGEFTVGQLHEALGKLIEDGVPKRTKVCVEKKTFTHALECDGCTILNVHEVDWKVISLVDDDGGTKMRDDGTECSVKVVVLVGNDPHASC